MIVENGRRKEEENGANKFQMYWLLPNFFLFALAFGGIIVPKLNLILSLVWYGLLPT